MKIVVDTRRIQDNSPGEYGYFLSEILRRITKNNPGHQFIFIFKKGYDKCFEWDKNVTAVINGPSGSHPLLIKLWYNIKIPQLLKKYQADVFVTGDGICSLASSVPQCLLVYDIAYLFFPSFYNKVELYFLKKNAGRFLQKAKTVITVSEFHEENIICRFGIAKEKISVVKGSGDNFNPLDQEEKDEVKRKYTEGKNFFLYAGPIDQQKNLVNLLKAFSVFKKRQKSDWKLVLAGAIDRDYKNFETSVNSYKYRGDVVMTGPISNEETARLIGAAYVFIIPNVRTGSGVQVMGVMKSKTPVISSENAVLKEIAGDAVLYTNPPDHNTIAEKMMLLYKDESLRNRMIEKGGTVAEEYTWEKAAELTWQAIRRAGDQTV